MNTLEPVTMAVLDKLEEFTGKPIEKDPDTRAAIIARENADPETRARKEQKIKYLLNLWEQWGLIKLVDEGEQL